MISDIFYWLQIIAAILIIAVVIMQPNKGDSLGSMAGGTSSNGNKSFIDPMTKLTGFVLLSFMFLSFLVSWSAVHLDKTDQNIDTSVVVVEASQGAEDVQ